MSVIKSLYKALLLDVIRVYFFSAFIKPKKLLTPYFDSIDAINFFISMTTEIDFYVEWGAGGSTYFVAKRKIPFITIETNKYFLKSIRNGISNDGFLDLSKQRFVYADIGVIRGWGMPLLIGEPSDKRIRKFRSYSNFPSIELSYKNILILIDGRFRVASALKAFKALANNFNFTLIVDDYINRPEYHVIEKYGYIDRIVGSMAVFKKMKLYDSGELNKDILKFEMDFR